MPWHDYPSFLVFGSTSVKALWHENYLFSTTVCALLLGLVLCRVWNFSIRPLLHQTEFPYLPYFIPFIGHGIHLFLDTQSLYDMGSSYFGGLENPYMLYVAGKRILVVTSPRLVDEIAKDSKVYTFDGFVDQLYRQVANVSEEAHPILWRTPAEGYNSLRPNPKNKTLVYVGLDLLHHQILKPDRMQALLDNACAKIDELASWDSLPTNSIICDKGNVKVISLYRWCRDGLVQATTQAFFGSYIQDLEPNHAALFDEWKLNSWTLQYGFPPFLARTAVKYRERTVKLLLKYVRAPAEKRAGGEPFVGELEEEMRHAGLSEDDRVRVLIIIFTTINANVHLVAFWMLSHILNEEGLAMRVRREILLALNEAQTPYDSADEMPKIGRKVIDQCRLLRSTFCEALRITSTGCTVRNTTIHTRLDGKIVPPETMVFMPHRPMLRNRAVFGQDAQTFNAYRFLESRNLERSEFFRPFGSGTTGCTGRTFGRYESLIFVATLLLRHNPTVVHKGESVLGVKGMDFPRVDDKTPSLGVANQVRNEDMIIVVSKKNS